MSTGPSKKTWGSSMPQGVDGEAMLVTPQSKANSDLSPEHTYWVGQCLSNWNVVLSLPSSDAVIFDLGLWLKAA